MPDDRLDVELFDRYLAGEASLDEGRRVREWLEHPAKKRAFFRDVLEQTADEHGAQIAGWESLQRRFSEHRQGWVQSASALRERRSKRNFGAPRLPLKVFKAQPLRQGRWYVLATLIIGLMSLAIGWHAHTPHGIGSMTGAMSQYATAPGERAVITLPDGNVVALSVASRLDVPVDYASGHHTVYLSGEALFTATRHDRTPFTVVTGAVTARVLGTSFAMRHYRTDSVATVAVRDGKVAVGNVVVTAAKLLEVGPHGVSSLRPADPSLFGFASGVMQVKSMPLSQAIPELNRWYGAEIRLGDVSLAQVPIEGEFLSGSISDLSGHLTLLLNVRVVRDGRVLTIYPQER